MDDLFVFSRRLFAPKYVNKTSEYSRQIRVLTFESEVDLSVFGLKRSKVPNFEFPGSTSDSAAMLTSEAAALPRLKQLEERQVETAVELMAWSPKMDILALATKSGDLQLCRAAGNWQKIWEAIQ